MAVIIPALTAAWSAISAGAASAASAVGIGEAGAAAGGAGLSAASLAPTAIGASTGLGAAGAAGAAGATSTALEVGSLATSLAGGAVSAYGQYKQGQANSAAAKFNQQVALANANQAKSNEQITAQAGAAQAGMAGMKSRAAVGGILATAGARGVDVNSGSSAEVLQSAQELGQLDALSVRSNATKEAYGYQVQGVNQQSEANLEGYESQTAEEAGEIGAAGTFLGGVGSASNSFLRYQLAGGFGG